MSAASNAGTWFALICGVLAVLYGIVTTRSILALPAGNARYTLCSITGSMTWLGYSGRSSDWVPHWSVR